MPLTRCFQRKKEPRRWLGQEFRLRAQCAKERSGVLRLRPQEDPLETIAIGSVAQTPPQARQVSSPLSDALRLPDESAEKFNRNRIVEVER